MQALRWLAATPVDQHLLVALLAVLSSLLRPDTAQQAQQQLSMHANVTQNMQPWTVLLRRTCDVFKGSSGTDTHILFKVLPLTSCHKMNRPALMVRCAFTLTPHPLSQPWTPAGTASCQPPLPGPVPGSLRWPCQDRQQDLCRCERRVEAVSGRNMHKHSPPAQQQCC